MKVISGGGAQPLGTLGWICIGPMSLLPLGGRGAWHVTETIPCPQLPGTAAWAEPFEKTVLSIHRVVKRGR